MQELEEKIGYTFKTPKLLQQALTHSSFTPDIHKNYERLEFLGDRILGVTVADMLCRAFANEPEGSLSQRFVCLVCKETVAEIVRGLGADKYIIARDMSVAGRRLSTASRGRTRTLRRGCRRRFIIWGWSSRGIKC